MRDVLKSKEYFKAAIHENETIIKKLYDKGESYYLLDSIYFVEHFNKLFYMLYSIGESIDNIYPYYENWVKKVKLYLGTYCDYLDIYEYKELFSLGVLFQDKKEYFLKELNYIAEKSGIKTNEASVYLYLDYLNDNEYNNDLISELNYIDDLIKADDKEKALKKLIKTWYSKQKKADWYGKDKLEDDKLRYKGYWNFEAAALAKIYGIPDEQFKYAKYYPYDLSKRNPIKVKEKYTNSSNSELSKKRSKKIVKFAYDLKEKVNYDDMATITKIAYIVSNGNKQVVKDFTLIEDDYKKFFADNIEWFSQVEALETREQFQKMLTFAYWLTNQEDTKPKCGVWVDWKGNVDDVISQLKVANKILKYNLDFEEFETEKEDLEEALPELANFINEQNYGLLYLDTDSDCYHIFLARLNDEDEIINLGKEIGFKFIKL